MKGRAETTFLRMPRSEGWFGYMSFDLVGWSNEPRSGWMASHSVTEGEAI